jgi:hypothetical protein
VIILGSPPPEEDERMPDPRSATHPVTNLADPAHAIARELLGVLPFGARAETLTRCPRLVERADDGDGPDGTGERTAAAVVEAIESLPGPVRLPGPHPDPVPSALVQRMLHVLLATRDLGWPGTDAPLSVRRVAAADLYFDATQTVLSDHDWKGPNGVEFALLTALAGRVCHMASLRAAADAEEGRAWDTRCEMLGHLHRLQWPRAR